MSTEIPQTTFELPQSAKSFIKTNENEIRNLVFTTPQDRTCMHLIKACNKLTQFTNFFPKALPATQRPKLITTINKFKYGLSDTHRWEDITKYDYPQLYTALWPKVEYDKKIENITTIIGFLNTILTMGK